MSGPKVDSVTLARERERLERERLERERKARERALAALVSQQQALRGRMADIETDIKSIRPFAKDAVLASAVEAYLKAAGQAVAALDRAADASFPSGTAAMEQARQTMADRLAREDSGYRAVADTVQRLVRNRAANLETAQALRAFSESLTTSGFGKPFAGQVYQSMADIPDKPAASSPAAPEKKRVTVPDIRLEDALTQLRALARDPMLPLRDKQGLLGLETQLADLSVKKQPFEDHQKKQWQTLMEKGKADRATFRRLYEAYCGAYVQYLEMLNQQLTDKLPVTPKPPEQFAGLAELDGETERILQRVEAMAKQRYIRETIDKVMRRHRYRLVGELDLDAGNAEHSLFLSEDGAGELGRNQGIRLSLVRDARGLPQSFVMQVVGVEKGGAPGADRLKSADSLSPLEKRDNLAAQVAFCRMHPQIVAELKAEGVLLQTRVHKAADEEHCANLVLATEAEVALDYDESLVRLPAARRRPEKKLRERALRAPGGGG